MFAEELTLTSLTQELLEQTIKLCDKCVGENLYTLSEFAEVMESRDKKIFLLVTPKGKVAAYIYFKLADITEAEGLSRQSLQDFNEKVFKKNSVFGILQSIGVCEEYRNYGLSERLSEIYMKWLLENTDADIAFGVFWKPNGKAPMESVLKKFGFSYLTDSKNLWYDNENLVCPVCNGRCRCDAAIYYKLLERNEMQ